VALVEAQPGNSAPSWQRLSELSRARLQARSQSSGSPDGPS
jgi:hypothetical protein